MKAQTSAKDCDIALASPLPIFPEHDPSATSSKVSDDGTEKISTPSNAATTRGRPSTPRLSEHQLSNRPSSPTATAHGPPASKACNSRSSSLGRISGEGSNPEPPYHVLTYRRRYLYVALTFSCISTRQSVANHILLVLLISLVMLVSLAASLSPLSSNIYFPALDLIADALRTDNATFATSVSIYMYRFSIPSNTAPCSDAVDPMLTVRLGLHKVLRHLSGVH